MCKLLNIFNYVLLYKKTTSQLTYTGNILKKCLGSLKLFLLSNQHRIQIAWQSIRTTHVTSKIPLSTDQLPIKYLLVFSVWTILNLFAKCLKYNVLIVNQNQICSVIQKNILLNTRCSKWWKILKVYRFHFIICCFICKFHKTTKSVDTTMKNRCRFISYTISKTMTFN